MSGPSVELTREHISPKAAEKLQADIKAGRFSNPSRFVTCTGTVCDFDTRKCWFECDGKFYADAPKHTLAMFWNE